MKIIPAIDVMEGKVVRLYKGDPSKKTVYSDNPLEIASKWQSAGADMLHLVDLDATLGLGSNFELIQKMAKSVSIPVQIAGRLRNENIIENALDFSQRVVLGTLAFKDKVILDKLRITYGSKRIVISVDHKDVRMALIQAYYYLGNYKEAANNMDILDPSSAPHSTDATDLLVAIQSISGSL